MPPNPPYIAFSFDYQSSKKEIVTPCRIENPHVSSVTSLESTALWDTGATHSIVNLSIAKSLQLVPIFREMISGVHGTQEADGHIIEITLPNHIICKEWPVMGADIGQYGLLIGMDIIGLGDFSICSGRFFSYCLPSLETPVDFVKKAERANQKNR